jgi:hypothetical protein
MKMIKTHEFIPNDRAIWQSDTAKTYRCPICRRPIFSQWEGQESPTVDCRPDGHQLTWTVDGKKAL